MCQAEELSDLSEAFYALRATYTINSKKVVIFECPLSLPSCVRTKNEVQYQMPPLLDKCPCIGTVTFLPYITPRGTFRSSANPELSYPRCYLQQLLRL